MKRDDEVINGLDVPPARALGGQRRAAVKADILRRVEPSRSVDPKTSLAARFLRPRHRLLVPVLAAVIAGASAGSLTTAYALAGSDSPSATPAALTTISTEGTPVALARRAEALPGSAAQAFLMARLGPTAYLRVPLEDGTACFYTGRATEGKVFELGGGSCWTPAPRFPLLDLSPIQADGPGGFRVLQIQGFATDGVKTIAVEDLDGNVIATTAVRNNVYKITAYPPGGVSALVGLDQGKHVVQRISYSR